MEHIESVTYRLDSVPVWSRWKARWKADEDGGVLLSTYPVILCGSGGNNDDDDDDDDETTEIVTYINEISFLIVM